MANILIVDDDDNLCACVSELLTAAGHQCQCVGNGEAACRVLSAKNVDLIILDVMIPGISGFELCRRIHVSPHLYDTPILFVSAMNSEEEIAHGLAQGADDYLAKPFKAEALRVRVERLLAAHGQERVQDELTGLCGPKGIKLDIQRAVTLKETFAVAYVELLYLNEFSRVAGKEGRERAMRHLARGLQICAEEAQAERFRAGHMGGGHFVCLIEAGRAESFAKRVRKMWDRHSPRLYESVGVQAVQLQDPQTGQPLPMVDVLCCLMMHAGTEKTGVQEIFETLSHLRENAHRHTSGGVFIDRRA